MPNDPAADTALLREAAHIAHEAGAAILDVYRRPFDVKLKDDSSPLTEADLASHELITRGLRELTPDVPILSEEAANDAPYAVRRSWTRFWLVDPLDGTKEFIRRNGEFTVNIALIEGGTPVLGVVHAPALGLTYTAAEGGEATRSLGEARSEPVRASTEPHGPLVVVASRSHAGPETQRFLDALRTRGPIEVVSRGSALKICQVAAGEADLYPRLGPTMEWDTAAAHAVALAAGAHVVDPTGRPLTYNKPDLHNPHFLVSGAHPGPYLALLEKA